MSVVKKADDEIRLKVIEALMQKHTTMPSIREIQKKTGLHKATIKASLDFLEEKGILTGFGPKINFRGLGYKLEVVEMLQIDTSKKSLFNDFLDKAQKDPNLFRLSATIGSGTWNIMAYHIYKDVESYHKGTLAKYYEKIPNIYELIKDRQIFYATEPLYKNASRTDSILEIIKKAKGID